VRREHQPIKTEFTCDRCGSVACTLTLLPPFADDPQAPLLGTPGAIPGGGTLFADHARLSIDGPVTLTATLFPNSGTDIGAIGAAIRAGDAYRLYSINPEYAPFICRQCVKSYCKNCWQVWETYDDDYPGWYEDTRGRCPEGHVRLMAD
jgi:hypothetical protein